jgi:hypothetical protein
MYREAIAIEGCKEKGKAHYGLGLLYMLRQEASRAGDEFREAVQVHPCCDAVGMCMCLCSCLHVRVFTHVTKSVSHLWWGTANSGKPKLEGGTSGASESIAIRGKHWWCGASP